MDNFVREDSIVREIWGKPDTILFIFAAASAEFALNKAVDWLFFTGKLPADPLGRLFSTVTYAREIVFSSLTRSNQVIDRMASIHKEVESKRGSSIPDWAYRDVLFMLIDYSIRSYELLNRNLTRKEKEEVYDVFKKVGERMGLSGLSPDFDSWTIARAEHLQDDLTYSDYTTLLFKQYKKHLGYARYQILLLAQSLVIPPHVKKLLNAKSSVFSFPLVLMYKILIRLHLDWHVKRIILPEKYIAQVKALEIRTV